MPKAATSLDALLEKQRGMLRLTPTYARRFYRDGGRMAGGKPGATFISRDAMWLPERWIASGTEAMNPKPIPGEGLSRIAGTQLPLRDAFARAGDRLLGPARFRAHGPEFRVLIKILDGDVPIVFHFHADDDAVAENPKHFPGHRFGKDEAYYFLDRPKGRCPYTHVGLRPGTGLEELIAAIRAGSERTLELSPVFLQTCGEGFLVPAGIVHRPGTALTLEVQQPSDVYTLLEDSMDGVRFTPQQMHPGFKSLAQSFKLIDMKASSDPDILDKYRLVPTPVSRKQPRGAVEHWIYPPRICRKFSGKRLRVTGRTTTIEPECYAVLVWKGAGRAGPHNVKSGDEFFVSHDTARKGITIERTSGEYLELFKFFAAPLKTPASSGA